jgi:hypothetical protein
MLRLLMPFFCSWVLKAQGEGGGGLACCAALRVALVEQSMLPPHDDVHV